MTVLMALALTGLLVGALVALLLGVTGASPAEFFDRPVCWLKGHPAPGSRYLMPTVYNGRTADSWRCSRCDRIVTVVR